MSDAFARRRARVLELLGEHGALVIAASPALFAADTELRYAPDADLYYLTGYTEPGAVLVLCPSAEKPYTMFVRPRDAEQERWSGVRGGVEAARDRYGADVAHEIGRLADELPKLVEGATTLYARVESGRAQVDTALRAALAHGRHVHPRTGRGPRTVTEPHALLGPLRMRKEPGELELIREAARITVESFRDAARGVRGAPGEWQVEAALEHGFRSRGASGPAFPTIAAHGPNASVLHYIANEAPLREGELLLLDAGARYRMYCADVSRTWPVGGRFTDEQRAVYDVVLSAYDAILAAVAPGRPAAELDDVGRRTLVDGMLALGLLTGSSDDIIEKKEYRRYFPHRVSHWLGLDVHDAGDYAADGGGPLPLEESMVLTIEPGLYIPADDEAAPAALRGISVRLEDDVVVTPTGATVLTHGLPLRPEAVEALVAGE